MISLKILRNRDEYLRHGSSVDIVKWDQLKLAYITVPKTANTSIKTAISLATGVLSENERCDIAKDTQRIHGILRSKDSVRTSREELSELNGYTIFATVRHPKFRFLSFFKDKIQNHGWMPQIEEKYFDLWSFSAQKSANQTLRNICRIPDQFSEMHFRSQSSILGYPEPPSNLVIHKFEQLDKLWSWLQWHCTENGVDLPANVPKFNATTNTESPDDPRLERLLKKRYAEDYKIFDYE